MFHQLYLFKMNHWTQIKFKPQTDRQIFSQLNKFKSQRDQTSRQQPFISKLIGSPRSGSVCVCVFQALSRKWNSSWRGMLTGQGGGELIELICHARRAARSTITLPDCGTDGSMQDDSRRKLQAAAGDSQHHPGKYSVGSGLPWGVGVPSKLCLVWDIRQLK